MDGENILFEEKIESDAISLVYGPVYDVVACPHLFVCKLLSLELVNKQGQKPIKITITVRAPL